MQVNVPKLAASMWNVGKTTVAGWSRSGLATEVERCYWSLLKLVHRLSLRVVPRLLTISLILAGGGSRAVGQTTPEFEKGIKPFGSYDGSGIEVVNFSNQFLRFEMPLVSYRKNWFDK